MTRSTRSLWSFSSAALFGIMTLVTGLVATPWLVHWLGDERFGATRTLIDWFGYVMLLEFGVGGALLPLIARGLAREDEGALRGMIGAGARAYRWIALLMLLGSIGLLACLPWLVPVRPGLRGELWWAGALGLIGVPLVTLAPLRLFLEGYQRSYLVTAALLVQSLVLTGLWLLLAWWGWGIASYTAAAVVASVALNATLLAFVLRWRPAAVRWVLRPADDEPSRRALWRLNWPTFGINVSGRVALLSDNIVIALFLSPVLVTPFFLTQRLAQIAQAQLQGLGNAGWAAMAELYARDELVTLRERIVELTRLTTAAAISVLVPIAAFNGSFIALWVGPEQFAGRWLTILACANSWLWSISSLWGWVFSATARQPVLLPLVIVGGAANVVISVLWTWLASRAGSDTALLGPLIGTGVGLAFNLPWLASLLRRDFGLSARQLLTALLRPSVVLAPIAVGVFWFAHAFPPAGWISMATSASVSTTLLLLAAWSLVLTPESRIIWKHRLRLALGR